jgi:pimeloyl-ACP methyl ester carboxylesterase
MDARILAARLPHAELEIVRNAGHLLIMQRASTVAARISEFLASEP